MADPSTTPSDQPRSSGTGRRTRALRRRRRRRYGVLAGALVLTLLVVVLVVGLSSGGQDDAPAGAPTASATPLDQVDLTGLRVARGPFCGDLGAADVRAALGSPVSGTGHYTPGERALLAPGVRDLAHEYDCTFLGDAGAQARTWVFAAPVTPATARALVRDGRADRGCREVTAGPRFGSPSITTRCTTRASSGGSPAVVVTLRGLFTDSWLSCQLTVPATAADGVVDRAQRWCVQVATAAASAS